jgi:hypothetical protein
MDTKRYTTRIDIDLGQVGQPDYQIRLDGRLIGCHITAELTAGTHVLEIEHLNKQPDDPRTALIIRSIKFNDITSDKFVWRGVYTPDYPEPWASEQTNLAQEITNTNYLGWNGIWRLEFTAPIFTWIHGVEDLGWIYR